MAQALYLDIETLPGDARIGIDPSNPPGWAGLTAADAPRSYKKPETIAKWIEENDGAEAEKWWRGASLDPMRGRVGCIGWAVDGDPVRVIDCVADERSGLLALRGVVETHRPRQIIAHNGERFDFAFLRVRMLAEGIEWKPWLWQEKPWDGRLVDTCQMAARIWGRAPRETRGLGMDPLAAFLRIPRPENPINGSEVLDAYLSGRWSDVIAHVLDDVRVLREIHRRFVGVGR